MCLFLVLVEDYGMKICLNLCTIFFSASEIGKVELELSDAIERSYQDDARMLQNILDDFKDKFHKCHYLILILKWLLLNIYGRQKGFHYPLLNPNLIQEKVNFCQDYLTALDIIDPGISHNRGRTLWETYSVKAFIIRLVLTIVVLTLE